MDTPALGARPQRGGLLLVDLIVGGNARSTDGWRQAQFRVRNFRHGKMSRSPARICVLPIRSVFYPVQEICMAALSYPDTRYEPSPLLDLNSRAERERLSAS